MATGGSKAWGYHEGIRQCHRLSPCGSQTSLWPRAVTWTTDSNIASNGITDHCSPLRRSNPESVCFLWPCSKPEWSYSSQACSRGWVCVFISSRMLYTILLTLLLNMWTSALSLTQHWHPISGSTSLQSRHTILFSVFPITPSLLDHHSGFSYSTLHRGVVWVSHLFVSYIFKK